MNLNFSIHFGEIYFLYANKSKPNKPILFAMNINIDS